MIKFGSICSGIESASMAWELLGMQAAWFSEIEPFPSAVLAHHWPHVMNLGDMCEIHTMVAAGLIEAPDVLVGGTPCQAFSVAGLRKGLDDERGQLTLKYVELLNEIDKQRPNDECVAVWENVPGVLSSKDNAFGCFLGALAGEDCELFPSTDIPDEGKNNKFWRWDKKTYEHRPKWTNAGCVFGPQRTIAWRILDAQYFGVAQRRRRVFVVASARNGFDPRTVLFESESMRRDIAPSRETREEITGNVKKSAGTGHRITGFHKYENDETASTIRSRDYKSATDLIVSTIDASYGRLQGCSGQDLNHGHSHLVVHGSQDPCVNNNLAFPVNRNNGAENVVFPIQNATRGAAQNGLGIGKSNDPCYTLDIGSQHAVSVHQNSRNELRETDVSGALTGGGGKPGQGYAAVRVNNLVRRLTPIECERLQGFPDNHTRIPYRKKTAENCPDGPRYKAIGNSKAVLVVQWIGKRLIAELNKNAN